MIHFRIAALATLLFLPVGEAAAQPVLFKHEPMVFFVARGDADACGPGCDTWIAAEGTFDPEVHQRLTEFLAKPARQRLPIFFHSPGGELQPSIAVGNILRDRRMTAGIGQTIPDGCREARKADEACRKLMRSGRDLKARLRVDGAICASGCAYALVGASARIIGSGARLGVHASRLVPRLGPEATRDANAKRVVEAARVAAEARSYDLLRQYVTLAGVDAAFIDLAIKTPHNKVHWLSREDMARLGIIPGEYFETRWFRIAKPGGNFLIVKSVTQPSQLNRQEYRTTNIGIDCVVGNRAYVTLRRELPTNEQSAKLALRMISGDAFVLVFTEGRRPDDATELRVQPVAADALARAASQDAILLREEKEAWSRETKLSTKGLSEALSTIPARCGGRA